MYEVASISHFEPTITTDFEMVKDFPRKSSSFKQIPVIGIRIGGT